MLESMSCGNIVLASGTHPVKEVIEELLEGGARVRVYDPVAMNEVKE